jgi:head-tail adaptor
MDSRRHRIAIQKKIERRNSCGEVCISWEKTCEIWAEIRDDVVTVRYMRDLLPGYRVVIGDSYFEIVGVIDRRGKTRLVELHVSEIKETGRQRFCPAGVDDEQQPPRAFVNAR